MTEVVPVLPVLLAVLSALASSVNLVLQRDSSREAPAGIGWWRLAGHLVRTPRWLLGEGSWLLALGLQALALHFGPLSVVQPVLVTELAITLLIRRFVMRWHVRAAAWWSAALLCGSLVVFLASAEPRGGHPSPTASAWLWAVLACGGVAAVAAALGRRGTPARRAACCATAAAVLAALEAALLKTVTQTLSTDGPLAVFTEWPVYALAISGAASGFLVQAALRVGPLAVSQPLLVVLNPLASIALSVWLFGEHFTNSPQAIALGGCAFLGLAAGVFLLTSTGPRSPEVVTRGA